MIIWKISNFLPNENHIIFVTAETKAAVFGRIALD